MPNLLRADLFVLVRSRALWVSLVVASAMAVGYFVSARLIANGTYDMSIAGSVASFSDAVALPLLGSLLIGVTAARDLDNRTVHDRLLAAGRPTFVAVKTLLALLVTCVVLSPYVVGALVCLGAGWDLTAFLPTTALEVAANTGGGTVTASTLLAGAGLGAACALVYVARLGLCLPVALATRRPLVTTVVGLVSNFVIDALLGILKDNEAATSLLRLTPWSTRLPLTPSSPGGDVAAAVAVSLVFLVLWGVAGWLVMRRADIA